MVLYGEICCHMHVFSVHSELALYILDSRFVKCICTNVFLYMFITYLRPVT